MLEPLLLSDSVRPSDGVLVLVLMQLRWLDKTVLTASQPSDCLGMGSFCGSLDGDSNRSHCSPFSGVIRPRHFRPGMHTVQHGIERCVQVEDVSEVDKASLGMFTAGSQPTDHYFIKLTAAKAKPQIIMIL